MNKKERSYTDRMKKLPKIFREATKKFGVKKEEILFRRRSPELREARKFVIQKMRELGFSYAEIGFELDNRDESTIRRILNPQKVDQLKERQ